MIRWKSLTLPYWLLVAVLSLALAACGEFTVQLEPTPTAPGPTEVPPIQSPTDTETAAPYPPPRPTPGTENGTVSGAVCFPSEFVPAMTAYFQNVTTGAVVELPIAENQTSYSVSLKAGTYRAFAYLPGGQLGGMYSEAVICGLEVACTDHTPAVFTLDAGGLQEGVDLCDWYDQAALPPRPQREPLAGLVYAQPFGGPFYQLDENGIRRLVTEEPLPRFSPDGKFYLFEQRSDLWIGDLTSGETRNLTNTPDRIETRGMWWPARPDTVVFGSWGMDEELALSTGYLSTIRVDGTDYRVLETEVPANAPAAPGPDGETIAYDRGGEAYLYRLEGGPEPFDVAAYGLDVGKSLKIGSPAWSPEGEKLAWWTGGGFAEDGSWGLTLAVFDLKVGVVQQIHTYVPIAGSDGWLPVPVWSPDGAWIAAMTRGEFERVDLWLLKADGSEKLHLGRSESPVWRPDGGALAFARWLQRDGVYQDSEALLFELDSWEETVLDLPPDSFPLDWPAVIFEAATVAVPWFSPEITFSTTPDLSAGQRVFPFGTQQVYALWSYANMADGMVVRREWVLDEGVWLVREEPWDFAKYGPEGIVRDISVFDFETQLPPGTYRLRLYIDGIEQTIQEDAPARSFTIAPSNELPAVLSPDGSRTALVEPPGRLVLQDAGGARRTLVEVAEISHLAWFPDGEDLLMGLRDRSAQLFEAGPIGLQESLWVVDAQTGETRLISEAAGNMRDPLISPDGRYVAGVGGVGFGDGCFVDGTLWILELDEQKAPTFSYYQLDFSGLPEAGSAFVDRLLEWKSDAVLEAVLGWACFQEGWDGTYRLDLDALTAERVE